MWQVMNTKDETLLPRGLGSVVMGKPHVDLIWKAFASSTAFFAESFLHFLPVLNTDAVSLTHLSRDSTNVISSLTLGHLNSIIRCLVLIYFQKYLTVF